MSGSGKRAIGDPLETAARTGKIGSRTSDNPAVPTAGSSIVQTAGSPAIQNSELPAGQQSTSLNAQTGRSSKVQNAKGERTQQTIYLPPDLAKWLRIQSIEEDREISEIAAEALTFYRQNH